MRLTGRPTTRVRPRTRLWLRRAATSRASLGPVRVAMSGRRVSPPLFESMEIVGKPVSLARLEGPARAPES